ncbi:MAG TPA: hypothetical protein VMS17_21825 [Gemmataceae bacterium]|nr:hypothetical protein [Gemmataceae bacterium]
MRMVPACFRALTVGAVLAWAASPVVAWAAPAGADRDEKSAGAADKLHADLDKVISIDIVGQPLDLAIQMLGEKSHIAFVLDSNPILQAGIQPNMPPTPVSLKMENAKVRTVLRKIVGMYGLSYAVVGDTVVVTTEDAAVARQMGQHINVDISKTDLASALKQLSRDAAVNLVLDPNQDKAAATKVTLQGEDLPLLTAVKLLSEMAGLKTVRMGNTLFVTSKDKATELRGEPDLTQPGQGGQPQPQPPQPGVQFLNPPGLPVAPPTVIGNPPVNPPPTPPAVDPDKPAPPDSAKPADDKKPDPEKKDPKDADK